MNVLSVKDSVEKIQMAESGMDQIDARFREFIVTEAQHTPQAWKGIR
jgi:hypothetical protein